MKARMIVELDGDSKNLVQMFQEMLDQRGQVMDLGITLEDVRLEAEGVAFTAPTDRCPRCMMISACECAARIGGAS